MIGSFPAAWPHRWRTWSFAACRSLALLGVALFAAPLVAQEAAVAIAVDELVAIQAGELPIILSAPHGGNRALPGVPPRVNNDGLPGGGAGFVTSRDTGTEELALEVAAEIERRFGAKPYYVISRLHRRHMDPNRPPTIAYDQDAVKPVYDRYHASLDRFCTDAANRFRRGLLLDLHGQGSRADTLFRGTQNGRTVQLLRERFGEQAHTGPASLFGLLRARGWTTHPHTGDGREQAGYTGGYIVQTYGSHQPYAIDAIQLEFGRDYRTPEARSATAQVLVDALVEYAATYLDIAAPPVAAPTPPAPTPSKPAGNDDAKGIHVAVYVGQGTSAGRSNVLKVLAQRAELRVRQLTADDIRNDRLAGCRVVIHPGGTGSGQAKALEEAGREKVRTFVTEGGGYLGICAGAYLATCDYTWSLGILDAKVIDRQHWARGFGPVDIGLTPAGRRLLGVDQPTVTVYYHQGPLLAPADNPDIRPYQPWAVYEGEIAKNGAPMGVMPGTTAIASGVFGAGRVVCFSPHPERTEGLEHFVLRAIDWLTAAEASAEE